MMARLCTVREPRWYGIPLRVAFITFLLTLLAFAVTLLVGIVGTVVVAKFQGGRANMTVAYRSIAFPVAIVVGAIGFAASLVMEVRHYRQSKALARMEKIVDC